MLEWLKGHQHGAFLVEDTETTIQAVAGLPIQLQRKCAQKVLYEILRAVHEIDRTTGPSEERDTVMKAQLERAKKSRHLALENGARDSADPDWASASLVESWLMANTGTLGQPTFDAIDGVIFAWLRHVLAPAEIEAAMESAGAD